MSSTNLDSVTNQGEFHSKVPRSEPLTTKGHAPGVKVGNDLKPEFHMQTLPAGTAPADRTFAPDTENLNPEASDGNRASPNDTLGGATSADVHTGLGQPGSGQSSQQLHGTGLAKGKKEELGLGKADAGPDKFDGTLHGGREKEHKPDTDFVGAEEQKPTSAEDLASEFP